MTLSDDLKAALDRLARSNGIIASLTDERNDLVARLAAAEKAAAGVPRLQAQLDAFRTRPDGAGGWRLVDKEGQVIGSEPGSCRTWRRTAQARLSISHLLCCG